MSNRHLSRTIAMQTLYEWQFNHHSQKVADVIEKNIKDNMLQGEAGDFVEEIVRGVTKNLESIDKTITEYAPEWPIEKITGVDLAILRIGIYEMNFAKQNPPKVIINESIEMAKTFGGESSGKFINGVLGAIYNKSQDTKDAENNIQENEPGEVSVGGVVYKKDGDSIKFALIKDGINKWTFPKGKIGDNVKDEEIKNALARELEEEIGIKNIKILNKLGSIDLIVNTPKKDPYPKKVYYYLVETTDEELKCENIETVQDAQWYDKDKVLNVLDYKNTKEIFNKAIENIK